MSMYFDTVNSDLTRRTEYCSTGRIKHQLQEMARAAVLKAGVYHGTVVCAAEWGRCKPAEA